MWWLYHSAIAALAAATRRAGHFSEKARLRSEGAKSALSLLPATVQGRACFWMHCASVGEFEQGRPLWDALRERAPDARFVLTFFSPSGAEQFRGRSNLGEVHYLPWDKKEQAAGFAARLLGANTDATRLAIFVKYEWWLGFHRELHGRSVPVVLVSGAFRQNQPFFQPWHPFYGLHRETLQRLRFAFVQSSHSCVLLERYGYATPCLAVGDTRLDRTLAIRDAGFSDDVIESWVSQQRYVLVAGSTWPADEALLAQCLRRHTDLSLLLAPHEIGAQLYPRLEATFQTESLSFYTRLSTNSKSEESVLKSRILVLDTIGLLSRAYRFGQLAYVGGGFGAGIHNTLEPATYGIPVAFGPRHTRFLEAEQLKIAGVGFSVRDASDLSTFVARFTDQPDRREAVLAKAQAYIAENCGATSRIMQALEDAQLI